MVRQLQPFSNFVKPQEKECNYGLVLLAASLILPSVNYFIYYIVILTIVISLIVIKPPSGHQFSIFLIATTILVILTTPKLLCFLSISDLKEFVKVVIFLLIFLLTKISLPHKKTTNFIFIIIILDFTFTALQWIHYEGSFFVGLDSHLHQENHVEGSLQLSSVRALGFFSDTAEHGSIIFLMYLYFLSNLRHRLFPKISTISVFICVLILISTQSKTVFIAFLISLPLAYFCIISTFPKLLINFLAILLLSVIILYIAHIDATTFEQYYLLFEYGFSNSSFSERQLIWKDIVAVSLESNPIHFLFGAGRGALEKFGIFSSVFDNDLVYTLNAYGIIGVIILLCIYSFAVYRLLRIKSTWASWLLYSLCLAPIIGLATDFISSLKVLVVLAVMCAAAFSKYYSKSMPQSRWGGIPDKSFERGAK